MNATLVSTSTFSTERLTLEPLSPADAEFVHTLVNTEGWLRFIGDRNVHSADDATAYVKRIMDNTNIRYWTVRLKDTSQAIGIVTFIKRDYLAHPDIGFAFLPAFAGKGYAFEAASCILRFVVQSLSHDVVLATTIPANAKSIKLLAKLGFRFQEERVFENEALHVYSVSANEAII